METVITMIILVGAAVVFLSNVFRQMKNEREQAFRRSNLSPRRRDSNTDRFLEEVNRRRQQAGRQSLPPPPVRPANLTPVPSPAPRRETYTRKPIAITEKPRVVRPVNRSIPGRRQLMEVLAVDKPAIGTSGTPEPALPADQPAIRRPTSTRVPARPIAPLLRQVLPFLQSRQTLRAGFVLHEILGPPRCRHQARVLETLAQGHNQQYQA